MRKLIVSVLTSADGFSEGPEQDLMVLPFDDGFSAHDLELLRHATTQLFGRRFFDGFHAYWSQVADDQTQPQVERDIARVDLGIEKVAGPALLGGGTNLSRGTTRLPLRLLEARVLPDSQLVLLRYDASGARRGPGDA